LPLGMRRTRRCWRTLAAALQDDRRAVKAAWKTKEGEATLACFFSFLNVYFHSPFQTKL
jgi:hypothetical protein